jgi:hypothetical protein
MISLGCRCGLHLQDNELMIDPFYLCPHFLLNTHICIYRSHVLRFEGPIV